METTEQRKCPRCHWSFRVALHKDGIAERLLGTSVNLSQSGAFIRTDRWHLFQVQDQAVLVWDLPEEFTGQNGTIRLRGAAVICRVDREKGGVAVEFLKAFRTFERVHDQTPSDHPTRRGGFNE